MLKKIVFVHSFNDRSGSPKVLAQVINVAHKLGLDIEILTSKHGDGFLNDLPGRVRTVFYRRSELKLVTLFYYLIGQFFLFLSCLRYRRQDVLFYVNTMMPFGAALAGKILNKPIIYHVHETSINPAPLKHLLRCVISISASKIIFVSEYLLNRESFHGKKQHVIHNAIDSPLVNTRGVTASTKFNVLMVSSLKTYKGVFEFFKIAEALSSNASISFSLVLNADEMEIEAWFCRFSIPDNVTIYPRQIDVDRFYEQADLVLNLSRPNECIETFGLTILEAMAHGIPVIVPPVGGPTEMVSHDCEGYLVSCYEVQKIADHIKRLAENPTHYAYLSQNAKARAMKFCLQEFERKIANVISQ